MALLMFRTFGVIIVSFIVLIMRRFFLFHELTEFRLYIACEESIGDYGFCGNVRYR